MALVLVIIIIINISNFHSTTTTQLSSHLVTAGQFFNPHTTNSTHQTNQSIKMPTSQISTPLNGVDAAVVITALHNHDLMIKTLCPALVSYAFESGDKSSTATYTVTDKKPIGQVHLSHHTYLQQRD
jgi:hypothetical protein